MIIFLAIMLVFIVGAIYFCFSRNVYHVITSIPGKILAIAFWIVVGFFVSLGITSLVSYVVVFNNVNITSCDNPQNLKLHALGSTVGTTGSGAGSFVGAYVQIDQSLTYHFFIEDNGYLEERDKRDLVRIYEDATPETAYVSYSPPSIPGVAGLFFIPVGVDCHTNLHVPPGTVTNQFKVDTH